jgi:hypothetical protein
VRASHKVLMQVDGKALLIAGNPQWILDQQLRPHLLHIFNIVIIIASIDYLKLYIILLFKKLAPSLLWAEMDSMKTTHSASDFIYYYCHKNLWSLNFFSIQI